MLTIDAATTARIISMNVNTQIILIDFWVVNTLTRVAITLTRFAFELLSFSIWLPFLLYKAITTCLALIAASIMRTTTDQLVRSVRIRGLAVLRMTVANAAAANRYITNTVKVSSSDSGILFSDSHQMSEKILGSH